jgi:hypothetical protein
MAMANQYYQYNGQWLMSVCGNMANNGNMKMWPASNGVIMS